MSFEDGTRVLSQRQLPALSAPPPRRSVPPGKRTIAIGLGSAPAAANTAARVQAKADPEERRSREEYAAITNAWTPVVMRPDTHPEPVQLSVMRQSPPTPSEVHALAAEGAAGAATSLPHLDRIQRSFGHHDVGGIKAHVGGRAEAASAAMGAHAYATGDQVAFRESPSLHTAAHEAAHVVQQRGGVHLAGGVGTVGDPYERHADQIADAVTRGKSAEAMLDQMSPGASAVGSAVQRELSVEGPAAHPAAPGIEHPGACQTGPGSNSTSDPVINRIAEIHPDGITIVLYANYPETDDEEQNRNNREFVTQGRGAAERYQAVFASGDQVVLGQAIPIVSYTDISQSVNRTCAALRVRYQATRAEDAGEEPRFLKVNNLAIFCHGARQRLLLPGTNLTTRNVSELVGEMASALHPGVNVQLFACNAAGGEDSLAETMAVAMGDEASVYGHTTADHTTENAQARVFGAAAGGDPAGQHMRDIIFPPAFIDAEITRIWGAISETDREFLRPALTERIERFYESAAGLRGGWRNEVRQAMQPEVQGEGYYARHSMFGREMFMNPNRSREVAQRHFRCWVATHIGELEALYPVTEDARNGTNASTSTVDQLEGMISPAIEYFVRDSPGEGNIVGILALKEMRVKVLSEQGNSVKNLWFKVRFTPEDFALVKETYIQQGGNPSAGHTGTTAWVRADAMGYVAMEYDNFLRLVDAFDATYATEPLRDRLTRLRQIGEDSGLYGDDVVGRGDHLTGRKLRSERANDPSRWELLLEAKQVIMPNGEIIDIHHFILGLDALALPTAERSSNRSVGFGLLDVGESFSATTWSGDIGAAVADYVRHASKSWEQANTSEDSKERLAFYFRTRAPEMDLLGDIDAWGASGNVPQTSSSPTTQTSLRGIIESHYGPGGQDAEQYENNVRSGRAAGIIAFLCHYGFSQPTELCSQQSAVDQVEEQVFIFSKAWYDMKSGLANMIFGHTVPTSLRLQIASKEMTAIFLDWLECLASQFCVTSFE